MGEPLFVLALHESMVGDYRDDEEPWVQVCGEAYPATPADLIAALREEGAGRIVRFDRLAAHPATYLEPGRYLVVRIDGEET